MKENKCNKSSNDVLILKSYRWSPTYVCITFISSFRESSQILDVKVQNYNCCEGNKSNCFLMFIQDAL